MDIIIVDEIANKIAIRSISPLEKIGLHIYTEAKNSFKLSKYIFLKFLFLIKEIVYFLQAKVILNKLFK